jgi:predicted regulator of Ras-like GTPase activity (Roadblock/LC7/MglB family)
MAELFYKQGNTARAVGIYRKVVRERPYDAKAARRLRELEVQVTPQHGVAMTFREHMQHIVNSVPGATACALMGFDGIAIDSFEVGGGEVDIPTLLAEYSSAAQSLRHNSGQPSAGSLSELVIMTSNLTAVLRLLNEEYFLAVVLAPGGLSGKARYMMRQAAPDLLRDLA